MSDWNPPRRICQDKFVPAELAILAAQYAVEDMAADTRLTEAGMLLARAREKVADFVDGVAQKPDELTELKRKLRELCEKWQDLAEQQECADELEQLLGGSEGG